jgi:outer membrane lipoprotein-sorting protein
MKHSIAIAVFLAASSAWAQTPQNVSQIVSNVDAYYGSLKTYQTPFTQQYTAHAYNTTKTEQGTLSVVRPSQIQFVYANGNRASGNGSTVTFFNASTNQTIVQQVSQAAYGALGFLSGQASLASSFTFSLSPSTIPNGYVLVGVPKTPTPAYTAALFYIDAATYHVRRILLVDAQRNTNRFDF